ncbi:MAG: winged helix-turn-helix domain-containing protein [Saprospiraceae bacterium]
MKELVSGLNREFESRVRLGIMSILMVNEKAEFKVLKEMLELTDGNLASHLSALEKAAYIDVQKQFIDKKPNTSYSVTAAGKKAFNEHLDLLENFLNNRK